MSAPGTPGSAARQGNERAMVAGAEALALGSIILLAGTVLVANAWAVVDARAALDAAAREYLRAYTEADDPTAAARLGTQHAAASLEGRASLWRRTHVEHPDPGLFGPCAPAAVALEAVVPAISIPLLDARFGEVTVSVRAVELVDAHQEMSTGADHDPATTPCSD